MHRAELRNAPATLATNVKEGIDFTAASLRRMPFEKKAVYFSNGLLTCSFTSRRTPANQRYDLTLGRHIILKGRSA